MPEANTAVEVVEPASSIRSARPISKLRLDRAARELNLLSISSTRLLNIATIGQFVKEIGLLKYGHGRLVGSATAMQEGAMYAAQMARRDGVSDEIRQAYMELELRFLKALDDNLAMQLDVNRKVDGTSGSAASDLPQGKPFLPGAQISPIQINVHGGTVETPKEEPCKT